MIKELTSNSALHCVKRCITVMSRVEVTSLANPKRSSSTSSSVFPPGWEQRFTVDGRAYYINYTDKTSSWEDPRMAASVVSPAASEYDSYRRSPYTNISCRLHSGTKSRCDCATFYATPYQSIANCPNSKSWLCIAVSASPFAQSPTTSFVRPAPISSGKSVERFMIITAYRTNATDAF